MAIDYLITMKWLRKWIDDDDDEVHLLKLVCNYMTDNTHLVWEIFNTDDTVCLTIWVRWACQILSTKLIILLALIFI